MAVRFPAAGLTLSRLFVGAILVFPMTHMHGQRALGQQGEGQSGGQGAVYKQPPDAIRRILEAPPTPGVSLDPLRKHMVLIERTTLPPVADLARPMLRLGGSRIDPGTFGPHGPRSSIGLTLRDLEGTWEKKIEVPPDASGTADIGGVSWSPDGTRFAFAVTRPGGEGGAGGGIELWVADVESATARRVVGPVLNGVSGGMYRWMPDGRAILCRVAVNAGKAEPERPGAPAGPVVQVSRGREAQVRTYQDLLTGPHDERLFEHYFTSQLVLVDAETGEMMVLGAPGIFAAAAPSPDGRYMLVGKVERPYSYLVPWSLFPQKWEVWDVGSSGSGGGEARVVRELVRMPLRDDIPIQGVQKGPRGYGWHSLEDAMLVWAEALDEGDPRNKVPHRDRVMVMGAPFAAGSEREVLKTEHRYTGMSELEDGRVFVSEYDRDRRWSRTWMYELGENEEGREREDGEDSPRLVWDRSVQDRYGHPGSPLNVRLENGRWAIRVADGHIYLEGQGATPEGDRPFLDRMSLEDFATERLWRNEGENYESVVDILEEDGSRILTMYESPEEPANYYIRSAGAAVGMLTMRQQITHFPDPAPELRDIKKELVTYAREDGVPLSATMYLPPGYEAERDGPLPLVVWAYPREYNDPATAGQVSGSPHRFTRIGGTSHLFLLLEGYAVMDGAAMPVIGDPETMNDTFIRQVVGAAEAAINKAVEMGVGDRERVAVGGHSYGAFMTANLLAHSDIFRAGIARSGAYNRTLTPFGFQGERRTFWEASETYMRLSPFTHAHKIKTPILLIHGEMDNNSGTFPMQSERMFHAINGHGGTARLVMLPYEGHGYQAKESVMHVLAEMVEWLEEHVKGGSGSLGE